MLTYQIKHINDERTLRVVLDMCYSILGEHYEGLYSYEAWRRRLDRSCLLLYAECNRRPIAAVLGREENPQSVIVGFAACREEYRGKGVTTALMKALERSSAEFGYSRITLSSYRDAWEFYQKCGYTVIDDRKGRRTYSKKL